MCYGREHLYLGLLSHNLVSILTDSVNKAVEMILCKYKKYIYYIIYKKEEYRCIEELILVLRKKVIFLSNCSLFSIINCCFQLQIPNYYMYWILFYKSHHFKVAMADLQYNLIILLLLLVRGFLFVLLFIKWFPVNVFFLQFPRWVSMWLLFSSISVSFDTVFILDRPESFNISIWTTHHIYTKIDKAYGDLEDTFVYAKSLLNIVEVIANITALFYLVIKLQFKKAALIAIVASAIAFSKAALYLVMEIVSGFKNTAQNDAFTFATFYIVPNATWVVVPAVAMYQLGAVLIREKPKEE